MTGRCAVLRLHDAAGGLLYVGLSVDPERTLCRLLARAPWAGEIRCHRVEWHETRQAALDARARAVATEAPRHNIRSRMVAAYQRCADRGYTMGETAALLGVSRKAVQRAAEWHGMHFRPSRLPSGFVMGWPPEMRRRGKSVAQIARALGTTRGSVYNALSRDARRPGAPR